MNKQFFFIGLFSFIAFFSFANEKIHSVVDDYYTALSLTGQAERSSMNYRSFSSNTWDLDSSSHPWQDQGLEQNPFYSTDKYSLFLENPNWYSSYNHNSPYGGNDGGLWQGKGYNTALSGGVTFDSEYVDITFYPEIYFSQNSDFDLQTASSWSGSEYGYAYDGIDLVQRFGDEAFFDWSWGQTQVRFNYNQWTLGFGTENIWIGPAYYNAPMQSTNADGYPHIDLGMEKTETRIGDIEFRLWWGALQSSDYNERVEKNSFQDFVSGISISYSPSFMEGFTLGLNKTSQVALDNFGGYSLIAAVDPGLLNDYSGGVMNGSDETDGRASITWSWIFDSVGFETYGEFVMEDYIPSLAHLLKRPDHASGYTLGIRQNIAYKDYTDRFFLFNVEISSLDWSMDYYLNAVGWGGGFYRHSFTELGYTNQGQCLGNYYGPGGNMQHVEIDYYAPFGMAGVYINRTKYDDTKLYSVDNISDVNSEWDPWVQWTVGTKGYYFIGEDFGVGGEMAYVFDQSFQTEHGNDLQGFRVVLSIDYRY